MSGHSSRPVSLGILAGLTFLLQLGPVIWPGGGHLLAMAAVLPAALGSALSARRSTWFYFTVSFLLGLIAPEEMFIYLTMTGPVGLMLGLTLHRPAWQSVLATAGALTCGMLVLPHLAGIRPFGGLESGWVWQATAGAYALCALLYAGMWHYLVRRALARLPFSRPGGLYWGK